MKKIIDGLHHIKELQQYGATSFPCFTSSELERIKVEIDSYLLSAADSVRGAQIMQRFLEATIDLNKSRYIADKISELTEMLKAAFVLGKDVKVFNPDLFFTEARIQKYSPCEEGIAPHRDESRYRNLVVSILIEGESSFYICDDKEKKNSRLIPAQPGHCILLAAPGLFGLSDRAIHYVADIKVPRTVIGLRQEIRS